MKKEYPKTKHMSLLLVAIYLLVSPGVHLSFKQSSTTLSDGSETNSIQLDVKKEDSKKVDKRIP